MKAMALPGSLALGAGAHGADFLANIMANLMGMKRPNPSDMSEAVSRHMISPAFEATGKIADALNPMSTIREAAKSAGWQDVEPEPEVAAKPSSSRDIGVGGPAPSRSIPRLGPRSPVVIDQESGSVAPIPPEQGFGDDPRLANAGAFAPAPQTTAPGDEDLGDRYRKRVAGIQAPKGDLTPEQENKLRMGFFMHMLANNAPGSRFLQNAGASGVATGAEAERLTDKNLARSTQQQQFARDEVFKEMGLSDKSQDNREKARHQKALEDLQRQANEINKQYREGQITAREAELEVKKIQAEMAQLRASANPLEAQLRTIRKWAPNLTNDEVLRMGLSKGKSDEDQQIDETWKAAVSRAASTGMPAPSRDQIVAIRKYGNQISRNHPDYMQALKDPGIGGDKRKLDAILQTRGLRVVD